MFLQLWNNQEGFPVWEERKEIGTTKSKTVATTYGFKPDKEMSERGLNIGFTVATA